MLYRRLPPILLSALLVACSVQDPVGGLQTDTLRTELPPAELPTYARGDSYTFDNPRETWTVTTIVDGLITWHSSLGGTQTTVFDPLLPPIKWQKPNTAEGGRHIVEWSGSLFPLKAGNKLTYKSSVHIDFEPGRAVFVWNCYAGHPRRVSVPAGEFAAIPVYCRRSDGRTLLSYYAPALNGTVSITHGSAKKAETVRNLLSFKVGTGARIAAGQPESLPGGWSNAAVVKWDRNGIVLPRLKPELVVTANPPLSFAEPAQRSSLTPKTPPEPPAQSEQTRSRTAETKLPKPPAQLARTRSRAADTKSPKATAQPAQIPSPTPKTASSNPSAHPPTKQTSNRTASRSTPEIRIPKAQAGFGAHLGSFSSKSGARQAWKVLGKKHKSLRSQIGYAVYPIDLGRPKGVLYRLVAGPVSTRSPIRDLCTQIKNEGGYCRILSIKPAVSR